MRIPQPPASKDEFSSVRMAPGSHRDFFSRPLARAATEIAAAPSLGSDAGVPLSPQFFIAAAMAVVSTAIGCGLYLQLGVEFAAALLVAVATYTALLAMHLLVRRRHTLVGLRSEIDRIETEIAVLRADRATAGATPAFDPAKPEPRQGQDEGSVASATAAQLADGERPLRDTTVRVRPNLRNSLRRGTIADDHRQTTQVRVHPEPETDIELNRTTAPFAPESTEPGREPEGSWQMQPSWEYKSGQTLSGPGASGKAHAQSGDSADTAASSPQQPATSASMLPAPEPAHSFHSDTRMASAASEAHSAEERDAIQLLIRRLADDLNTGRAALEEAANQGRPSRQAEVASPAAHSSNDGAVAETEISRSVAALRTVASTMREASTRPVPETVRGRDKGGEPTRRPAEAPPRPSEGAMGFAADAGPALPSASRLATAPAGKEPTRRAVTSAAPATNQIPDLLEAIASAVETGRMNVFVEPIIGLADRKARHFEVSVRLHTADGAQIADGEYRNAAEGRGLLPRIDAAKMQHSAVVAGRLRDKGRRGTVHSAISGEALTDGLFVEDLTTTVAGNEGIAPHLVLTFAQSDVRGFTDVHWDTLAVMREFGMTFALEAVTAMDMDFDALANRGFTFVKLDASVFLEGMPTEGGLVPAADLCRYLAGLGLGLIIGHIEDERSLARVLGFGALLGQGTLFGAPRPLDLHLPARSAA